MGGGPSKPTPESMARTMLQPPLDPKNYPVVIGTVALNKELAEGCCNTANLTVSHTCNCCAPPRFDIPWPAECFGYECRCCPHLPKGGGWESALAAGFGSLVVEAAQLTIVTMRASLALPPHPAIHRHIIAGLEVMRAFAASGWLGRANAALQPHGLSVNAFCWVEEKHDDKGNKTGEAVRTALQFYAGPPPVQIGVLPTVGPMGLVPAPQGMIPPPPPGSYVALGGGANAVAPYPMTAAVTAPPLQGMK